MYVRWKRKQHRLNWGERVYLSAVLVESVRVDGKPRQKFIAHLGSIIENHKNKTSSYEAFYRRVNRSLNQVGVDRETKLKILQAVQQRVPKPDPDSDDQKIERRLEEMRRRVSEIMQQTNGFNGFKRNQTT